MRDKSVEKFKETIKKTTKRSHNLDQNVIERLNQVIRGTVNFFATKFSTIKKQLIVLDGWIRTRIRSMKFKRKWKTDHTTGLGTNTSNGWDCLAVQGTD